MLGLKRDELLCACHCCCCLWHRRSGKSGFCAGSVMHLVSSIRVGCTDEQEPPGLLSSRVQLCRRSVMTCDRCHLLCFRRWTKTSSEWMTASSQRSQRDFAEWSWSHLRSFSLWVECFFRQGIEVWSGVLCWGIHKNGVKSGVSDCVCVRVCVLWAIDQ